MTATENIKQVASQYWKLTLWIVIGATLIGLFLMQALLQFEYINYVVFSAIYSLITAGLYVFCWKKVAKQTPRVLTQFYMGGSVLKMLLALLTAIVGMFVVRDDRSHLIGFACIFAGYYLLTVFCDGIYFARVEKHKKISNNSI